jgi:hypothetical protein
MRAVANQEGVHATASRRQCPSSPGIHLESVDIHPNGLINSELQSARRSIRAARKSVRVAGERGDTSGDRRWTRSG